MGLLGVINATERIKYCDVVSGEDFEKVMRNHRTGYRYAGWRNKNDRESLYPLAEKGGKGNERIAKIMEEINYILIALPACC